MISVCYSSACRWVIINYWGKRSNSDGRLIAGVELQLQTDPVRQTGLQLWTEVELPSCVDAVRWKIFPGDVSVLDGSRNLRVDLTQI